MAEEGEQDVLERSVPAVSRDTAPVTMDALFGDISKVSTGLANIKRSSIAENERIMRGSEGHVEQDRTLAKRHYDAAGVEAEKMQPWNAQQEYDRVAHSPLEAFGSFASAFAIVASAFTRAPMENALNASAAAMTAIKKGDDQAYERAHVAWKENTDLVKKRFDMQNTLYKDALDLMTHDQAAGRIKLQNAALRFGDQKTLFLLEQGYDKDVIDLQTSRIRQVEAMTSASDKITESTFRRQGFDALQEDFRQRNRGREPNAMETMQQWNYAHGMREQWQQSLINQFIMKHQGDPELPEKAAKYAQSLLSQSRAGGNTPTNQILNKWRSEYLLEHGTEPSSAEEQDKLSEIKKAQLKEDLKTKSIKEIQEKSAATGTPISIAEATKQHEITSKLHAFNPSEQRRIPAVPTLMRHLDTLDWFANQTGFIYQVPAHIAGVYFGLNTPKEIYEAALAGARTASSELASGGTTLKTALLNRLARLPGNYQDPKFNKRLTQELMQDTTTEAKYQLSLLEQGGKSLPRDVLEAYTQWGIYPDSMRAEDPHVILRLGPQNLTPQQIKDLARYQGTLSLEEQRKFRAEIERRLKVREQERQNAPAGVP